MGDSLSHLDDLLATLSTNCPTKVQSLGEIDFLRFAAIFRICLINADIRS